MKKLLLLVGLVVFLTPMVVSGEEIKFKCDCKEKLGFKAIEFQNPEKDLINIGCLHPNLPLFLDEYVIVKFNQERESILLENILFLNANTEYYTTRIEIREKEIFAYIDEINGDWYRQVVLGRYDGILYHKLISPNSFPYEIIQEKYQCKKTNKIF